MRPHAVAVLAQVWNAALYHGQQNPVGRVAPCSAYIHPSSGAALCCADLVRDECTPYGTDLSGVSGDEKHRLGAGREEESG